MDFMQAICSAISFDTVGFVLALYIIVDQVWHLLSQSRSDWSVSIKSRLAILAKKKKTCWLILNTSVRMYKTFSFLQ
jgi:hypothetical protein